MKERKWFNGTILCLMVSLFISAFTIIVVDPFFHFHAPVKGISYQLSQERYINDGIARHFDYDAVITGTSMTQNFKTSEFDELFGTRSIKLPFSGGGYNEISNSLKRAFGYNENINKVLWAIDGNRLIQEIDFSEYEEYPLYLYDDNIFNDVNYVLNKDVMCRGAFNIAMTIMGIDSTTFDEYSAWEMDDAVKRNYRQSAENEYIEEAGLSDKEKEMVERNIKINICSVIEEHPDTTFYIFFPPYSIVCWDDWGSEGKILAQIEAENIAAELLMQYTNVELYCFYENTDMICNLNNYMDSVHYSANINSQILEWIQQGEYRLTPDTHKVHVENEMDFYLKR